MTYAAESAGKWNELAKEFQSLADSAGGSQLVADATHEKNESPDVLKWYVHGAKSDTLREGFELRGSEAALALGTSLKETSSLYFLWLHRLYQYLCD